MKTARAVVIDEDRGDALSLLQALGQMGWSTAYVAGDDEALLPPEPLLGIRLVFLDLKLLNLPEPAQYLPHTVKVLERTVKMIPGVTGILCWTTHDEEIPLLREELAKRSIVPAFMEPIPNKLAITQSGAEGIKQLIELIDAKTSALPARSLLMRWEQMLHEGASSATDGLYGLGKDDAELMTILSFVAAAAAEELIVDSDTALDALFAGLSTVHIDALETVLSQPALVKTVGESLYQAVRKTKTDRLAVEARAKLNSILLTMDKSPNSNAAKPGNLYISRTWNPPDSFPVNSTDAKIRGFIRDVFNKRSGEADDDAFVQNVSADAVACAVEITPACDHANRKSPNARFVGGLLIKSPGDAAGEDERTLPPNARLFAKEFEFVWISNPAASFEGSYKLIVNARTLFTLPFPELEKQTPLVRLRHPVVSDLCAWFAAHASRPGYVSVH
jgi:hypothetical protein